MLRCFFGGRGRITKATKRAVTLFLYHIIVKFSFIIIIIIIILSIYKQLVHK